MRQKLFTHALAMTILLAPILAYGADNPPDSGFIVCNGPDCNFGHLILLVNKIISFLMYKVAVPLAAIGFVFVGARLVFNQDKDSAWSEARSSFTDIAKGFALIIIAFTLVKFVLYQFLSEEYKTFIDIFLDIKD